MGKRSQNQTSHKLPIRKRARKYQLDLRKLGPDFFPEGSKSGLLSYPSKAQAEGAAQLAWNDYQASLHQGIEFTPEMRGAAMRAFAELEGYEAEELVEAAKLYKEHMSPGATRRTVKEVVAELIASHEGAGNSAISIRNYHQHLDRLAADFGERFVHQVSTAELESWLDRKKITGANRKNYRRYLSILFRFAVRRNYAVENPGAEISQVRLKRKVPGILSAVEVGKLLKAASEFSGGLMLPYFAVGCFAGLRPEELRRISWGAFNFESREIYVSPEVSKTSTDRFVTMEDCLTEWLELLPASARHGKLFWTRNSYEKVRKLAGESVEAKMKTTKDIMRHSAASHLYRKTRSADITTMNMGHGLNAFLKHYKAAVTEKEAEAYFDVRPGSDADGYLRVEDGEDWAWMR